ncbi:MAG TPA: cysteine--tRNA ligase, partial [Prolixibacteraceae bacterium]|nr:cysteine--tRNA ligase [Prolixibacteraceae bacterium]
CFAAMNDDFNSPIVIANLFDGVRMINQLIEGKATINQADLEKLSELFQLFVFEILGLQQEVNDSADNEMLSGVVDLLLTLRMEAKANKDWVLSDKIRNELTTLGFAIKDLKDGFEWEIKK